MVTDRPSNPARAGERIRQVTVKNVQRLGYRRIVQLLVYLVIIPTVLLLSLGIILMFVWSFWWGLIIALIGLLAFGGFAKGRWY